MTEAVGPSARHFYEAVEWEFVRQSVRIQAEAMAWQGGALIDGRRRIAVPEAVLRPACLDLLLDGSGRLRVERSDTGWEVNHHPAESPVSGGAILLLRPGRGDQPDGLSVLHEAAADHEALSRLAARAAESPAARERLAQMLAEIADDLLIPLTIFSPDRLARARDAILAQSLFDFWREIHRLRTILGDALTAQAGPILDPIAPDRWRFDWACDWRAECAIGEAGGWGPVYQVFRRHGVTLSPFAEAPAVAQAVAAAGQLPADELARRARYFED